jgi:hypothetical protein
MVAQRFFENTLLGSFLTSYSRARRLEDRIRKLCDDAISTSDPVELDEILRNLKVALHDHMTRVRQMVAMRRTPVERRRGRSTLITTP